MNYFWRSLFYLFLTMTVAHSQPFELVFWHSMAGHLGEEVQTLVNDFNHSQDEFVIKRCTKAITWKP